MVCSQATICTVSLSGISQQYRGVPLVRNRPRQRVSMGQSGYGQVQQRAPTLLHTPRRHQALHAAPCTNHAATKRSAHGSAQAGANALQSLDSLEA